MDMIEHAQARRDKKRMDGANGGVRTPFARFLTADGT